MSIRIGLIDLCMNNEVDLEHWPGKISGKGLGGWAPQKYLQTISRDSQGPPPPQIPQSLTPFLWENTLRTLVLTGFEKSLKIGKL